MSWTFELGYAMEENIGPGGLAEADIAQVEEAVAKSLKNLETGRESGEPFFLKLPYDREPAERCASWAATARERFDNFVLLGIGGSALGPRAIMDALRHPFHNLVDNAQRGGMRLFVCDNVDPTQLSGILDVVDLERTVFNVVSKSGGTAETAAPFMIIHKMLEERFGPDGLKERIVLTTDPEKGELRRASQQEGFKAFDIPPLVGGRYSVLTPVGLLPAAALGLNPVELLEGAAWADEKFRTEDVRDNPAALLATISYIFHVRKNRNILVMMPYHNGLLTLAEWFQQLWAESLGKQYDLDGGEIFAGSTPVRALGATDQHSQLQLYMEGPPDKLVVFLRVDDPGPDVTIPDAYSDREVLSYLGGHTLGELIRAEQEASAAALAKAGRPNITISLDKLDARALGAMFFLFEIATVIAGDLYRVNPFDQPGVEMGKRLTYGMMGRKGFERQSTVPKKPWRLRQE